MASRMYAKKRARVKSRQVYRRVRRLPRGAIAKKFANFVGKVTYKTAKKTRGRRSRVRRPRYSRMRRVRRYRRRY